MKRENKLELQTDTNGCLAGRAAVGWAWKTSGAMLCLWLAPGHPRQDANRNPAEQQEKKMQLFVSRFGNWQGTLSSPLSQVAFTDPPRRAFRRKHLLTATGAIIRPPWKRPREPNRNKQIGSRQRPKAHSG